MIESCTRRFLRQIAKYSHRKKKKEIAVTKTSNPAIDSCRICKYFFKRLIAFFLSSDSPAPADGCIAALILAYVAGV